MDLIFFFQNLIPVNFCLSYSVESDKTLSVSHRPKAVKLALFWVLTGLIFHFILLHTMLKVLESFKRIPDFGRSMFILLSATFP